MQEAIVHADVPVTLIGGGHVDPKALADVLRIAPRLIAADGGAAHALAAGHLPEAVIGDMDSLQPADRARLAAGSIHRIAEQDSTDFEKVLQRVRAPMLLAVGFLGRRLDHQLAALTALTRHARQPCLLLGADDIAFAAPPEIALSLPIGSRLSLYPLAEVTGRSEGLEWPIEGLTFTPSGRIGTSNRVTGPVRLSFDAPGMIVLTPPEALDALLEGFAARPAAPAR